MMMMMMMMITLRLYTILTRRAVIRTHLSQQQPP